MILQPLPRIAEQAIEDPAHGEDGWAGIDGKTAALDPPHLAAKAGGAFDNGDLKPLPRKVSGCGQAAHPCPDDDDLARHVSPMPRRGASGIAGRC
ncbi:hypothetical protein NSE01_01480 [Novosphingobium sediminis]|uniref:Uncharacterized protein n=1 Tax=Novosphingobium sediminis TaxID=707214 RepID=A0A512AF46_9SPHN|nr:hypothetical protein NSE01_01480 [Novosphingobium sediminis]